MTDAAAATTQASGGDGGQPQGQGGATFVPNAADGNGQAANTSRDWLPKEYHTDPAFRDIADVGSMAKAYKNAQQLVGAKALVKPAAGASPEEMAAWRKLLGVPEKPDGYKQLDFTGFDNIENYPVDELKKNVGKYMNKLHELGAPPEIVDGLMGMYMTDVKELLAAKTQVDNKKVDADDAAFAEMTTKAYGADAAKKVAQGQALLATYLPPEMADTVKGFSNDQLFSVLTLVNNIAAKHIAEDKMPKSGTSSDGGKATDADRLKMQAERMELLKDPYKNKDAIDALNKKIAAAYGRAA